MPMKRIINIGSLNLDKIYQLPHTPLPGETLTASSNRIGLHCTIKKYLSDRQFFTLCQLHGKNRPKRHSHYQFKRNKTILL